MQKIVEEKDNILKEEEGDEKIYIKKIWERSDVKGLGEWIIYIKNRIMKYYEFLILQNYKI